MKAIILCAGLGSRLRPWTLHHPKALVPVGGVPMLKKVADSLRLQGFDQLVINVHHFSSQIIEFVKAGNIKGSAVEISDETESLLDTGGGILNAEKMLLSENNAPFLVHNVDILSNADLRGLYEVHVTSGRDVTLLVSERNSSRKLAFNSDGLLCGWMNTDSGETRPDSFSMKEGMSVFAFSGIYVMSPVVFETMRKLGFEDSFPIMDFFLRSIGSLKIGYLLQCDLQLIDIGKPDTLCRAQELGF